MPSTTHVPRPYTGPSVAEVAKLRATYCNPALSRLYREPLMLVEGKMQYVWDEQGTRYLDLFAGIATVSCGHCHPHVVAAVQRQAETLAHATTVYLHPNIALFAEKLAGKMPDGLDVTYFVNSGSEANDLALLMARIYTGNPDVIAVRNAYHGASPMTNNVTSHSTWKYPANVASGVHHTVSPDPYRSRFHGTPEEIATESVAELAELIRFGTTGAIAAFIAEPIQGVGGVTHGARNYLKEAYAVVRAHGGLCIADEVQTGFGRTGEHFWGFQNFDVVPDIVVMAKGIGNGVPLAAVTTRREIADALTQRVHFNTFGGNPVCMAAGIAVLETLEADGLQENARVVGARLKAGLMRLMTQHQLVGDVRGIGLMLGVELVRDRTTKAPASAETLQVMEGCRQRGVLVGKGGIDGNVLRIKPPLCITAADADFAVEMLGEALAEA
jgi:alanine-glyoxylate transaminase/(R)-3-amino-2-methylpropionate-pyruvate transaminase